MAFIEFNLALIKIWKVYVVISSIKRDDCVKKIKQLKSANIGNREYCTTQFQQCLALLEEIKAKCISLKKFKMDANAALEKTEKQLKIPQSYSEAVERLNREDHLPILAQPLQGQVSC